MSTGWKIAIVAIILIVAYFAWKYFAAQGKKTTKCYHAETNGTFTEVPCNTPGATTVNPTTTTTNNAKSLDNYVGQWIKAKTDGTKLYDDSLNVVATFNAGDDIGRLGSKATGYVCCTNNDQFYRILETSYNSGICQCEPIMSNAALKSILGI